MDLSVAIQNVRRSMDARVIGQEPVKEAILLGLVAREHLYLMGEPGCAKTLLAEVAANAINLSFYFHQLHRDTRVSELIGDAVLQRKPTADGQAEVISRSVAPGGILTTETALLDDISRAPGEALNVLLRLLNERKYQSTPIPLVSAIATTNPTDEEYYNEPLDPANLDRFTLQLRTRGTIAEQDWAAARDIIDRYQGGPERPGGVFPVSPKTLRGAFAAVDRVELPARVLEVYQRFLDALVNTYGCHPGNSLLTDRTMLVKVPRMIKALSFLEGRAQARVSDLRVLKYILTFRVPETVYQLLDDILAQLNEQVDEAELDQPGEDELEGQQQNDPNAPQGESEEQNIPGKGEGKTADEIMDALESQKGQSEEQTPLQLQAKPGEEPSSKFQHNTPQAVKNLEVLLTRIQGRLERNTSQSDIHPGGAPRSWMRMRSFDEFVDTDVAETAIWIDRINPHLPRVYRREKHHVGGELVIVRDVSQSMEGRYARWTSSIVKRLLDLVREQRMRIGYIEFNHVSRKYNHGGRFFTRDYDKVNEIASNVVCSGVTNYQFPLREALKEFRVRGTNNKHIIFLTDGEPTQGDWLVREERRMAKALDVAIHSLFIGTTECPEILDLISEETGGCQFIAIPDDQGSLLVNEREAKQRGEGMARLHPPKAMQFQSPPGRTHRVR